jgi:hypothetical protein
VKARHHLVEGVRADAGTLSKVVTHCLLCGCSMSAAAINTTVRVTRMGLSP